MIRKEKAKEVFILLKRTQDSLKPKKRPRKKVYADTANFF